MEKPFQSHFLKAILLDDARDPPTSPPCRVVSTMSPAWHRGPVCSPHLSMQSFSEKQLEDNLVSVLTSWQLPGAEELLQFVASTTTRRRTERERREESSMVSADTKLAQTVLNTEM